MTKKEVQQRVLKSGKPLDLCDFEWDEQTNTFSSRKNDLVLDFSGVSDCTFKTGSYCTFATGWGCTFKTGSYCTFDTGSDCTFKTGFNCTFKTGFNCTFDTGEKCVVVRRDVYEVIELKEGEKIKLNGYKEKGFTILEKPKSLSGKTVKVELDGVSYEALIK
jgi:hypothetical protein